MKCLYFFRNVLSIFEFYNLVYVIFKNYLVISFIMIWNWGKIFYCVLKDLIVLVYICFYSKCVEL